MTTDVQTAQAPPSTAAAESLSSDERWAAWQATCVAHDRAVRRTLMVLAPIVLIVAAAVVYALIEN